MSCRGPEDDAREMIYENTYEAWQERLREWACDERDISPEELEGLTEDAWGALVDAFNQWEKEEEL